MHRPYKDAEKGKSDDEKSGEQAYKASPII